MSKTPALSRLTRRLLVWGGVVGAVLYCGWALFWSAPITVGVVVAGAIVGAVAVALGLGSAHERESWWAKRIFTVFFAGVTVSFLSLFAGSFVLDVPVEGYIYLYIGVSTVPLGMLFSAAVALLLPRMQRWFGDDPN